MKKYYFLIIVALILGLVLTGCSLLSNVGQVPVTGQNELDGIIKTNGGGTYTEPVTLWAGQNIDVGTVEVWTDGVELHVIYTTTGGWEMTETHLAVADLLGEIPHTKTGNPIPGLFPYSTEHDPAVSTYTYDIPLNGWNMEDPLYIAAHAVVVQYGCYETVWQIGDVETDGCSGNLTSYANEFNWKKLDSTGGYTLPVDDCENPPGLSVNIPDYANPFIVGTTPDNEFPYNSNYSSGYATDFDVEWNGSLPFGGLLTISWSPGASGAEEKVVSGDGISSPAIFTATGGNISSMGWFMNKYPLVEHSVAVGPLPKGEHIINFRQTEGNGTFWDWIRLDKVCEETAWADGERFTEKGNWATYFTYTLPPKVDLIPCPKNYPDPNPPPPGEAFVIFNNSLGVGYNFEMIVSMVGVESNTEYDIYLSVTEFGGWSANKVETLESDGSGNAIFYMRDSLVPGSHTLGVVITLKGSYSDIYETLGVHPPYIGDPIMIFY